MNEIVFKPNAKQMMALRAKQKHVAYGGARGGGKSWFIRAKALLLANRYPGIKMLIIRKSFRQLMNNHVNPLLQLLHGLAKYNRQDKVFTFGNGSTIAMGYCATDADLDQYQGAEYDVIFLDEATQLAEDWIKKITACCRGVNEFPKRIYYTCNPGGQGHGYIKRLFVDRQFRSGQVPEDYTFIQAKVTDNQALMDAQPEYIRQLEALPPKLRKAWLEGSWDIFSGQFFEQFRNDPDHYKDRRWTHVIDPLTPRELKRCNIYRSFDWGYHHPFSAAWYAVDTQGVIYRILQLYGAQRDRDGTTIPNEGLKWTPDHVFSEMARIEREHPLLVDHEITGVADPAIWDAETGVSFAETAAKHGIFFAPGDHKRIPGWMQCHYRMAFDEDGYAQFYVTTDCPEFIRTIPILQYDEHKVQDLYTEGEDHIADEWRYMLMTRPISPVQTVVKPGPAWGSDPLGQFDDD